MYYNRILRIFVTSFITIRGMSQFLSHRVRIKSINKSSKINIRHSEDESNIPFSKRIFGRLKSSPSNYESQKPLTPFKNSQSNIKSLRLKEEEFSYDNFKDNDNTFSHENPLQNSCQKNKILSDECISKGSEWKSYYDDIYPNLANGNNKKSAINSSNSLMNVS